MNSAVEAQLAELGIEGYLKQHQYKSLLRFLTCGSVDDGKSTLIGRLLHDSKQIYEDQLAAVHSDSQRVGTTGEKPDLALLVDGLQAEREQGITIDVAYRYFSTQKRKFIIADTPGHEQYTRNMATGASTCDLAVILVDARKGILDQTRRHSFISNLLGLKHFVVAINKMDLVDYSQARFEEIRDEYLKFSENLTGDIDIQIIPISALEGDNVVDKGQNLNWFEGPSLLELLETVDVDYEKGAGEFRFPVQYVNRPNLDFRGFAGTVSSGSVKVGDAIKALPSGKTSTVARIVTFDGDIEEAQAGAAELPLNGIGLCEWSLNESVALDNYQDCADTGGFIIIDRLTNVTVGAGMVKESLTELERGLADVSAFELELNALVRKHFPHWEAKDLSQLLKK